MPLTVIWLGMGGVEAWQCTKKSRSRACLVCEHGIILEGRKDGHASNRTPIIQPSSEVDLAELV